MAETKVGTAVYRHDLSSLLAILRLTPEPGGSFPPYKAGQYIALRRNDCRLTRRIIGEGGKISYAPDLDASGVQKRGAVTHSYSISSAPFETTSHGYLEFYVILELHETGEPGRLTESLFQIDTTGDNKITYFTKIAGDFTLEGRAAGFENIVMVGTGTGLAPFASMVKQLDAEARSGNASRSRITLLHANRTFEELGYNSELKTIEREQRFDFVYVPSVSRPTERDRADSTVGKGRANNVLRHTFGMSLREEELLSEAKRRGDAVDTATKAVERAVKPELPSHVSVAGLRARMNPGSTVILTCGNPRGMEDIRRIAEAQKIQFEMEEW